MGYRGQTSEGNMIFRRPTLTVPKTGAGESGKEKVENKGTKNNVEKQSTQEKKKLDIVRQSLLSSRNTLKNSSIKKNEQEAAKRELEKFESSFDFGPTSKNMGDKSYVRKNYVETNDRAKAKKNLEKQKDAFRDQLKIVYQAEMEELKDASPEEKNKKMGEYLDSYTKDLSIDPKNLTPDDIKKLGETLPEPLQSLVFSEESEVDQKFKPLRASILAMIPTNQEVNDGNFAEIRERIKGIIGGNCTIEEVDGLIDEARLSQKRNPTSSAEQVKTTNSQLYNSPTTQNNQTNTGTYSPNSGVSQSMSLGSEISPYTNIDTMGNYYVSQDRSNNCGPTACAIAAAKLLGVNPREYRDRFTQMKPGAMSWGTPRELLVPLGLKVEEKTSLTASDIESQLQQGSVIMASVGPQSGLTKGGHITAITGAQNVGGNIMLENSDPNRHNLEKGLGQIHPDRLTGGGAKHFWIVSRGNITNNIQK